MPDTTPPVNRPASLLTAVGFTGLATTMTIYAITWPGAGRFILAVLTALAAAAVVYTTVVAGELRDDFDPADWQITDLDRALVPALLIIVSVGWGAVGVPILRWIAVAVAVALLIRAQVRASLSSVQWVEPSTEGDISVEEVAEPAATISADDRRPTTAPQAPAEMAE